MRRYLEPCIRRRRIVYFAVSIIGAIRLVHAKAILLTTSLLYRKLLVYLFIIEVAERALKAHHDARATPIVRVRVRTAGRGH